jgi:hypothetical protein
MSEHEDFDNVDQTLPAPLDLSKWRSLPGRLMAIGGAVALIGLIISLNHDGGKEFGYTWLLSFMFYLSICLGSLFLVLMHHLFDAGWSVATRRFCEHITTLLFPWMAILFVPVLLLAPRLYQWMGKALQASPDHSIKAKFPLFTYPGFYAVAVLCFGVWWLLSSRLKYWSLKQDQTGEAKCTYKMRLHSFWGIWGFGLTLTLAAIMWMKALQYDWYSTMYGVYYFAGSVWLALATIYIITLVLDRQRILTDVLHEHQFYFLGSLLFAFTVFYAYIHFAQYFVIWNANMPEETYWYVVREKGTWWWIGFIIIFGHFFLPFLSLLRIDVKHTFPIMIPLCLWAWLMHFVDLSFNILPIPHPNGFPIQWIWLQLGCMAFMGGLLATVFLKKFASAPPYPQKDPRLMEAMGLYHPEPALITGGDSDQTDSLPGASMQPKGQS